MCRHPPIQWPFGTPRGDPSFPAVHPRPPQEEEKWRRRRRGKSSRMAESDLSCSSSEKEDPSPSSSSLDMNAAVALADFARIAIKEREWGRRRRRRRRERKRIKNEEEGVRPYSWDLNQNVQTELEEELCQNERNGKIVEQKANLEMNCEVGRSTPSCSNSRLSLTASRGRTDLTEAEKEAKRLRRILANRESARQTIRRRQALCEELTRKAAELSIDNENMKKEKELVLKEYLLLNDTNRKLKEKVAEKLDDEAMTQLELETPASSSGKFQPVVHQRTPFGQLAYPLIAAGSLNSLKTNPYSSCTKTSYQQGTPCVTTGPMSNFSAQPYMWFYPVIPQKEVCGSIKTCVSNGTGGDSHNQLGTSYTPETTDKNLPSTLTEKSSCHAAKALPGSYLLTSATKLKFSQPSRNDPELRQESQKRFLKKVVNAATAAEARKRRKELTKLKRSHGLEPQLYF